MKLSPGMKIAVGDDDGSVVGAVGLGVNGLLVGLGVGSGVGSTVVGSDVG